jgi:choline dehydrogenase
VPGERTDLFDLAIVGAGSAGCAFAGRLATETDLRVALLEAGPDYGPWLRGSWPADLVDAHNSPDSHDWGFEQSRARVVGGCSAHNECALVRALPGDYDRWNVDGWRDAELTATIDRVWRVLPTRISEDEELGSWSRRFLAAALDAGFARHANAESPPGAAGPVISCCARAPSARRQSCFGLAWGR